MFQLYMNLVMFELGSERCNAALPATPNHPLNQKWPTGSGKSLNLKLFDPSTVLSLVVTRWLIEYYYPRSWVVRRTLDDFQSLDKQLHTCVYDRKFSLLPVIPQEENIATNGQAHKVGHQLGLKSAGEKTGLDIFIWLEYSE